MERKILRAIYGCKIEQVPPTYEQILDALSMHMSPDRARQELEEVIALRTEDGSIRSLSVAINIFLDEEKQVKAAKDALDIIQSPLGDPQENFNRALRIFMSAAPHQENGSQTDEVQRFQDFLSAQTRIAARLRAGLAPGIQLPFEGLQALVPTVEAGDMMLVTAKTGFGKTTFLTYLAEFIAWKQGVDTLYVHLETTPLSMQRRQIARHCLIPTGALRTGAVNPADAWYWENVFLPFQTTMQERKDAGRRLHYLYCPGWTAHQIGNAIGLFSESCKERGTDCEVLVDYIQKVTFPGTSDERMRIDRSAAYLKDMAGQHNCHITIASQESPGQTGEESSSFGSQGPKQYSQVHLAIDRNRAESDWRLVSGGKDVLDNRNPGQPRFWHRRGQWDSRTKIIVAKANDDSLGVVYTMWENAMFRIQEVDERYFSMG